MKNFNLDLVEFTLESDFFTLAGFQWQEWD